MFKMLKYEYRRGIFSLLVMFAVFLVEEGFFLWATLSHRENYIAASMVFYLMLAFASYVFVLIRGVYIFSQDLKNKSGYMVFMTPISSYKIVGAKLLCTLFTGLTLIVMIFGFGIIDFQILLSEYKLKSIIEMAKSIIEINGTASLTNILFEVLAFVIEFLVGFYLFITVAYLATALSATLLQNKKGKTVISVLLFVAIYAVVTVIANKLANTSGAAESFLQVMKQNFALYVFYLVAIVASYVGTAELLDKKISL